MTLELTAAARSRPRPRPGPGTDLVVHRTQTQDLVAESTTTSLDGFSRAAYATAGIGLLIAAAAFTAARLGHLLFDSRPGYLLYTFVVIGATMFVGGGITGSARKTGGAR